MKEKLKLFALKCLGVLGDFLAAVFVRGVSDQLEAILPIALEVVTRVENDPYAFNSDDKRKMALHELSYRLRGAAIQASMSTLSFAIELAVQKLKAQLEQK